MERLEGLARLILHGQVLLLLFVLGLTWILNRVLKRRRVNGALIFVVASVLLFTVPTFFLFKADLPGEPGQRASFYTYLSLAYFLPIAVGVVFAVAFKRKARGNEQSPGSSAP